MSDSDRQFGTFTASELYCPECRVSQPVRERELLVLATGEIHEYLCSKCATSLGTRTVTRARPAGDAVESKPRFTQESLPRLI